LSIALFRIDLTFPNCLLASSKLIKSFQSRIELGICAVAVYNNVFA